MRQMIMILAALCLIHPVMANDVVIENAKATKSGSGWRFDVTLRHADSGWDHYANKWEVLSMDGKVLGTRVLYHPHENEQPFTRSLSGVNIPAATKSVKIRAYDSVHKAGKKDFVVNLK